jgi:hypothetical protein
MVEPPRDFQPSRDDISLPGTDLLRHRYHRALEPHESLAAFAAMSRAAPHAAARISDGITTRMISTERQKSHGVAPLRGAAASTPTQAAPGKPSNGINYNKSNIVEHLLHLRGRP